MDKEYLRIILDLVLIGLIILLGGLFIFFIVTVFTDGGQCVLEPARYYADVNNISNICEHCKMTFGGIINP